MIKLKTKARKTWTMAERRLARRAAEFAMSKLNLDVTPIPVDIRLKGTHEHDYGDSIDLGHKVVIRIFKNDNWLRTLFHEMEHARQYIYCELELEHNHAIWRGTLSSRMGQDWEEYWNSPWEVEARDKEEKLFTAFQKNLLTSSS